MRLTICAFLLGVVALSSASCGRATPTGGAAAAPSAGGDGDALVVVLPDGAVMTQAAEPDPVGDALWTKATAADADSDDFARLAGHEGAVGLEARLDEATSRTAAIASLAYVSEEDRFDALPRLADLASAADEGDAMRALATIEALSARPHRAVDREDALELRRGCDTLLAFAPNADGKRAPALGRALTMLRDYGCAAAPVGKGP